MKTYVGLFDHYNEAEAAVRELTANGFSPENISLIAHDGRDERGDKIEADSTRAGAASAGATGGAVLGGLAGIVLGLGVLAIPGLGPIIAACGAFRVHRGRADREAIDTAVQLARDGHVIAMFPEGTRRRKGLRKRHTAHAHSGAARIAIDAGVPLVPAGIKGTNGLRRLERWRVRYGAPVEVSADPAETTERLMAAIHELEGSL